MGRGGVLLLRAPLCEKFQRASSAREGQLPGTGLGLAGTRMQALALLRPRPIDLAVPSI